ncbi:MAG: type VI secretion system baseplate subunit TssF [Planctomycetes bacterium]|nr:type VI secretion system baseplate subunit TssF [Planctomycetota bacterium]MCB9934437.1 type VI secretion system baseplate subunit TssF [Planctomycetota bacterium]
MFNKYYQDELVFLRDMGREFSAANPEAARFLAEPGSDPDVERMLEGFAFLAAKLRQKLDDELPEFTHSLTEMLWPHYLRPIPSTTIMQFEHANRDTAELKTLPPGIEIDSVPVDGTRCRFRTSTSLDLLPLELLEVQLRREAPARLRLQLKVPDKLTLMKAGLKNLRLHLAGEPAVTRALYVSLLRHVRRVVVRKGSGAEDAERYELPASAIRPVGFREDETLLGGPGPSFPGFRLLQEYFTAPAKFMFIELERLDGTANFGLESRFTIDFEFSRLPDNMPPVSRANLQLNCVPAVNLFKHDADPVRLQRGRTEYAVRPTGDDPRHYEVHSIDRVYGLEVGTAQERVFSPQFRLARSGRRDELFYHARRREAVAGTGSEMLITFLDPEDPAARPNIETVTLDLTCTNAQLPSRLDAGDVSVKTGNAPLFARYRNISRPTASVPPPLSGDLHWRLIAHLSLNYMSLLSAEALRSVIGLYNFRARIDRQTEQAHARLLDGIKGAHGEPSSMLLDGMPVRGLDVELNVDEELLGGEGETFLLGSVLSEFFAQYVSLNAFSRLKVKGAKRGEVFQWPARIGKRAIL